MNESAVNPPASDEPEAITDASARLASEMIAEISHDLRSPLGAILLWARILRQVPPGSADASSALEMIDRSAASLVTQLEDMAATCGSLAGDLRQEGETTDLAATAAAAAEAAEPRALERDVVLEFACAPSVGLIRANPKWLRLALDRVLESLLHDAPSGAILEMRVDELEGRARCRVTMTGPGASQPVASRDRSRRGILRARLARRLVESLGGQLSAGGLAGLGYEISLPLITARETSGGESPLT